MGWLIINVVMELLCVMTLCWFKKHEFRYGKDVIPDGFVVVPHLSGHNSTMVAWWCLMVKK